MYYTDPSLYNVTWAYRDFPMQAPYYAPALPFQSVPFQNVPFQTLPFQEVPFQNPAYQGLAWQQQIPWQQTWRQIPWQQSVFPQTPWQNNLYQSMTRMLPFQNVPPIAYFGFPQSPFIPPVAQPPHTMIPPLWNRPIMG